MKITIFCSVNESLDRDFFRMRHHHCPAWRIGTLDEIFSVAASHCIGYMQKRVALYNMKVFWNSLVALLDDMSARGMMRGSWHDKIEVADSLEDIKNIIASI